MRCAGLRACVLVLASCGTAGADPVLASGEEVTPIELDARPDVEPAETYVGVLLPEVAVDVAPPTLAEVVEVLVAPGDVVSVGQPLATLDARGVKEELAITKAELKQREAVAAEARVELAQCKVMTSRLEGLARQGLESTRFAEQRARSSRASSVAAIAETQARIDKIVRQLADRSLRAPFSGTVATRYRNAGAVAGPDAPVLRIVGGRTMCRFGVLPPGATAFSPGDHVRLRPESGDGTALAVVVRRAPEVDPASRLVFIDAVLDEDAAGGWAMGTAVRVEEVD
jgi:multidrug efflux pump subunit AcrA (membrane-fusion protein)